MEFETIQIEKDHYAGTIWLNRPEIHNAFNDIMIRDIIRAMEMLNGDKDIRVILIRGRGKSFSSGADIHWLKGVKDFSYEENLRDSLALSECFHSIYSSGKPVITVAHGAAIGGAVGLLVAADIALCADNTVISLSEVKIGVVPACISPYILKRTGEYHSRELMLTGRRITGREAASIFLVNKSVPETSLEHTLKKWLAGLLKAGPQALKEVKSLVNKVANSLTYDEAREETAKIIARIRASQEAQEGMRAFLEKRKPSWRKDLQ